MSIQKKNAQFISGMQVSRRHDAWKRFKKSRYLYAMIFLPVVYFIIWHYWPMYGIQVAFRDYFPGRDILQSPWVGFQHFTRFFNSYYFWTLIKNTFGISIYSILIGLPAPILLALLFNELRSKKAQNTLQLISYAPNFISVVVTVGIIKFFVAPEYGVINKVLVALGMHSIDYLSTGYWPWHVYVWSGIWQGVGWSSLIYTAAMSGIPSEQYEAAYIDGANKLQRIRTVTIPNIMPTIVILTILSMSSILSVGYEKILLLQTDLNLDVTEVISTYVYKSGIIQAQYSFSTAVGLFNTVINFAVLIIVNTIAKKVGETSLW